MNLAIVDVETSGLDSFEHEIIDMAVLIVNAETLELVKAWQTKIFPLYPLAGDPKAYALNGYNEEDWKSAVSLEEALDQFVEITAGATLMAWNLTFDWGFIRQALADCNLTDRLHYHRLCLMSAAWARLPRGTKLSLKSVSEFLGLQPEPSIHRAINGAMGAYEILKKL